MNKPPKETIKLMVQFMKKNSIPVILEKQKQDKQAN